MQLGIFYIIIHNQVYYMFIYIRFLFIVVLFMYSIIILLLKNMSHIKDFQLIEH